MENPQNKNQISNKVKAKLNYPEYIDMLFSQGPDVIAKEHDRVMMKLMRVRKLYEEGKLNPDSYKFIQTGK